MLSGTTVDGVVFGGPAYNSKRIVRGDVILEARPVTCTTSKKSCTRTAYLPTSVPAALPAHTRMPCGATSVKGSFLIPAGLKRSAERPRPSFLVSRRAASGAKPVPPLPLSPPITPHHPPPPPPLRPSEVVYPFGMARD